MPYALTTKSQVTVPKSVRQRLQLKPGDRIDYADLPDGRVELVAVPAAPADESILAVLRKWRGTGIAGMSTDEIMRETRGDDWNR